MGVDRPHPCLHCAYRIQSEQEAGELLRALIKTAHMRVITEGGTLIEAHLTPEMEIRLCPWEDGCADCEDSFDVSADTIEQITRGEVAGDES